MATSGTWNFNPSLGSLTTYAYNMCGVRPTALTQQHFEDARMATNMLLGRWSSQGVNLWAVDLQTVPLIQGQATYSVPANTIVMLDAYITQTNGSTAIDRIILPVSRTEYASYPNKTQQGEPTVVWFDRLLAPTFTLWLVPDGNETSFNYYRLRQVQDAGFSNGQQLEVPYYFLDAFAYALAQRLAIIWAPERAAGLKGLADEAYEIAASQNIETSMFYVSPMLGSFYRN